jgi:hypothetical protein
METHWETFLLLLCGDSHNLLPPPDLVNLGIFEKNKIHKNLHNPVFFSPSSGKILPQKKHTGHYSIMKTSY